MFISLFIGLRFYFWAFINLLRVLLFAQFSFVKSFVSILTPIASFWSLDVLKAGLWMCVWTPFAVLVLSLTHVLFLFADIDFTERWVLSRLRSVSETVLFVGKGVVIFWQWHNFGFSAQWWLGGVVAAIPVSRENARLTVVSATLQTLRAISVSIAVSITF